MCQSVYPHLEYTTWRNEGAHLSVLIVRVSSLGSSTDLFEQHWPQATKPLYPLDAPAFLIALLKGAGPRGRAHPLARIINAPDKSAIPPSLYQ